MGISEVCSSVSRKGFKVGSVAGTPLSPGARSAPGQREDSVPAQPKHGASAHQEPPPQESPLVQQHRAAHQELPVGSMPVTIGPED
jgi:hypothetical protein